MQMLCYEDSRGSWGWMNAGSGALLPLLPVVILLVCTSWSGDCWCRVSRKGADIDAGSSERGSVSVLEDGIC